MTRLRATRQGDQGFTIVEVMVVTLLVMIVGSIMLSFLVSTTDATTRAGANVEAERDARIVLRTITEDIRGAAKVSTVYPGSPVCPSGLSFASPYGGYQNCISITIARPVAIDETCPYTEAVYGLAGGVLRTTRREFALVSGTCTMVSSTPVKVLMTDLVNTAGLPLFKYFDRTGTDMLIQTPVKSPATAASIKVNLVKRYRKAAPNLVLSSVVALRNNR